MVALTSTSPTARPAVPSAGRSYLAPDLIIRGHIRSEGVVEIDAAMQGEIQANGLIIGSKGRVRAAIEAEQAVIAGTVEGVLKSHSVTFANGCDFDGDVQYEAIGVEPNASVQGGMFPVLNASPRPQQQTLTLVPSAGVGPCAEALSPPAPAPKTDPVPLSSSRAVLWVVTLLGVLIGAGLAATISAPPPLRQWWAAHQQAKEAAATAKPASRPSETPELQPSSSPRDIVVPPPKPEPSVPASVEATRPVTTAPTVQAQIPPPPVADFEISKQAAQDAAATAAAKRQEITKATAEKVAAAKALAEKAAAARAEKTAAAAQARSAAPEEQAPPPPSKSESSPEIQEKAATPSPETPTAAKKTPPRKAATGSAAAPTAEGSCSWVMRCDGPDNSGCVSTRQCD